MESLHQHGTDVFVPAANRPAVNADMRAQDQSATAASLLDSFNTAAARALPCQFCEQPVLDLFRPRTLLQVMDTTHSRVAFMDAVASDPQDDDDDGADEMQCDAAPQPPMAFPGLDDMFTPVQCCSAPCWMAATLLRYGESDMIGMALKRLFPAITPSVIGGGHYQLYNQKRAMLVPRLSGLALSPTIKMQ